LRNLPRNLRVSKIENYPTFDDTVYF